MLVDRMTYIIDLDVPVLGDKSINDILNTVKISSTKGATLKALGIRSGSDSKRVVSVLQRAANVSYAPRDKKKRWLDADIYCKDSLVDQSILVRRHLKKHPPCKCAICNITFEKQWRKTGKPVKPILDHINGDNRDCREENLRWVCPNCNQSLPTHCKGNGDKKPLLTSKYITKLDTFFDTDA
jgi:hypothetical protein